MPFEADYLGRVFDAREMFGPIVGAPPPMVAFCEVVVKSLMEFDGRIIDDALGERIGKRIHSLQRVASEFLPSPQEDA